MSAGRILTGPFGEATELALSTSGDPRREGDIAIWLLHCPNQSPAWCHFMLSCLHLRPIAADPEPNIYVAGATHEIVLVAIDPATNPSPTSSYWEWNYLPSTNMWEQIQVPNDEAAVELTSLAAQAVVDGYLWAEPPLSGQKEPWHTVLADTASHYRGEH